MEEKHKFIGMMGLIALRKSELYYKIISELSRDNQLYEKDKKNIKKYIAEMENERLLSNKEKRNKKIDTKLNLRDLDIDIGKIIKEIKC